jgi:hypothetical protein
VSYAAPMIDTHPSVDGGRRLGELIDTLLDCSQACTACADACLAEATVTDLRRCIRLTLDCADVCAATANVVSRQTESEPSIIRALVAACAEACRSCAEECERHGAMGMEHCRVCAEACRRCEDACRNSEALLRA